MRLERHRPATAPRFSAAGARLTLVDLRTGDGSIVDKPDDVAGAMFFLAPDDARFVNGVALEVDGVAWPSHSEGPCDAAG